jgi:hypothetical protein
VPYPPRSASLPVFHHIVVLFQSIVSRLWTRKHKQEEAFDRETTTSCNSKSSATRRAYILSHPVPSLVQHDLCSNAVSEGGAGVSTPESSCDGLSHILILISYLPLVLPSSVIPKFTAALSMFGSGWIVLEVSGDKEKRQSVYHH